jgi:hypothetical protein
MSQAGSLLGRFSALKMEVIHSSETSVDVQNTRRYIPEEGNIYIIIVPINSKFKYELTVAAILFFYIIQIITTEMAQFL